MSRITVFGIMVADMVARVQDFPAPGETVLCRDFETFLGGKGINQCISIKRLGGDVEMVGCLGRDATGQRFLDLLDQEGIPHHHILRTQSAPTGISMVQVNQKGENKIIVIPAANDSFGLRELEVVKDVFTTTEFALFQLEMRDEVTVQAIEYAHQNGVAVLLNPAPAKKIPGWLFPKIDYLTPNEIELGVLTGEDTSTMEGIKKAAQALLCLGVRNVVATLGAKGALIANQDGSRVVPGFAVDNVVDTVAAGDSFNGALALKLQEGADIEQAVKYANAMGALTVQVLGAIPSLHSRRQVEEFLALQEGAV